VRESGADLGIAWDGDFDRCFFFDDTGGFVDGEHVVGLLASAFLSETPGDIIVHDPRVIWNTLDQIAKHDGQAAISKTGHAYIKHAMRETGAVYGGEMSAHHYFRDFMCCDSGMIPWLKVIELMGRTERSLASLVGRMKKDFPSSGEINFSLDNPNKCLQRVHMAFEHAATDIDTLDGLSMTFDNWRFNLRASSTEPLVRLNVEANRETVDLPKLVEILQNEILK
jgi:phosphomannomutase